jgi:hypothetical protein
MSCGTAGMIKDALGIARKGHFQNDKRYNGMSKQEILSKYINDLNGTTDLKESEGIKMPLPVFSNFLHKVLLDETSNIPAIALRVYFATALKNYLPSSQNGTLTLIFAPAINLDKNRGDYYFYDISKDMFNPIPVDDANVLIEDFKNGKLPILQTLENVYDPIFQETQMIFFNIDLLKNWECNALNPGAGIPPFTHIQFTFGAYIESENYIVNKHDVKNQLSLQIDFFHDNKQIAIDYLLKEEDLAGDTGVPCPPPPSGTKCPGANPS